MSNWVVLELTPKGEKEEPATVKQAILRAIPGAEVYIPAMETRIGDDRVVHYLMQGYAFIRQSTPDRPLRSYQRLENTRYINTVLQANRKLATVDSSYIDDLREKMRAEINQGIGVNDTVVICSGPYKNIEASVIMELPETKEVQVYVQLRSKQALLTLPRSVLKITDRAPLSQYWSRLGYLRAWARMAKCLLSYDPPHARLQETYEKYVKVSAWVDQGAKLLSLLNADELDDLHSEILRKFAVREEIKRWDREGSRLWSFVYHNYSGKLDHKLSSIESICLQVLYIEGVENRISILSQEVEDLARDMARSQKGNATMTVQNVIVDGHNLAHRCFHAPGMNTLKDKQGNPTGVVVGFLRSLSSLKKRFPEARFWVTWDGSSDRRRRMFRDYKADRKTAKFPEQEKTLREILPLLGVHQAWNPQEEADDVVGTLVRKTLQDQSNLIFSSDRDFMQLVSDSTSFLYPAMGARKEVLFDPEEVKKFLGVPPSKAVELRAFFGDKSDNIPGVPRIPKKVLKSLLVAHGSVAGVYSSGLSGLNKGQYERLRTAEAQVKINRDLMSLVDVELVQVHPDADRDGASQRLLGIDANPAPITDAFFGRSEDFSEDPPL